MKSLFHAVALLFFSITMLCPSSAYAQHVEQAEGLSQEDQQNYAWLILISEPMDALESTPLTALDDAALAGLALPEHLDPRHRLPVFATNAHEHMDSLTLNQLVQLATVYRLRHDSPQAAYWYERVVEQSDNPAHIYFYAQALRESGYHASAKRVMQRYTDQRVASID